MVPDDHIPTTIGPYDILEVLGEGGMGIVYLASDARWPRWASRRSATFSAPETSDRA